MWCYRVSCLAGQDGIGPAARVPGIAIAVALSILNVFRRAWWPYDTELGRAEGLEGYHDVRTHPKAQHLPGLVIYRFDALCSSPTPRHSATR